MRTRIPPQTRSLRILHVLDHSIPLQSGYTFRTLGILKHQRALGWETFHLTTPKHTLPSPPSEVVDGWMFYRTAATDKTLGQLPIFHELALLKSTTARLNSVVSEVRPDVIHAHSPVLNCLPALWARRRSGIPVVYEVRAFWEDAAASHGKNREGDLRYRAIRQLETFALRRADAVAVICEGLRRDVIGRGIHASRVTMVPNAVDLEEFTGPPAPDPELARRLGLRGSFVLGFVGSFYYYEGLHLLLEAVRRLVATVPNVRLLLVGGGPESAALRAQTRELGLEREVVFVGRVKHDEIRRYYALADLLVYPRLPSRLTNLVTPLKPLEAMAQWKIVLASDVGGHCEIIRNDDTGYLFAAGRADALVACVMDILRRQQDWARVRVNGRVFVERERSWRVIAERYRQVYAGIFGEPMGRLT